MSIRLQRGLQASPTAVRPSDLPAAVRSRPYLPVSATTVPGKAGNTQLYTWNHCSSWRLRAKKRTEEYYAGEWAALAEAEEEEAKTLRAVTQVCTEGLRLMLKGDTMRLEPFKDKLGKFGQEFVDKGNMQGALFIYAVYSLAEHKVPKEYENLQGQYQEAYAKLFDILEDSGWRLKMDGEEDDDGADDLDMLPDQSAGYFQNANLQ
ncbi:hypothetical protein WJX73_005637 [Symbiochloris irregularis]|uniref:Uncharacterized protein n=1 Tax=Symbiochloris irregularis TaxID=706552 RepID=A0AAW1PDV7_9CHLO